MKILKAIGNFFVKIWRWIKNTAWVQPLLIVGAIFGIIFSIPAITSGIQGLINANNSADKFYRSFQKSMEGGETSSAERLLNNYWNKNENKSYELPKDEMKYFIMFTASNNSTASDIKSGFQTLKDQWNTDEFRPVDTSYPFKLYTVYTDEKTTQTTKNESAFFQFLGRQNWFFSLAAGVGYKSPYHYVHNAISKADLEKIEVPSPETFVTPTIILVDWTNNTKVYGPEKSGITQIMFNVPGANSYAKAKLLADCWNNRNDFHH